MLMCTTLPRGNSHMLSITANCKAVGFMILPILKLYTLWHQRLNRKWSQQYCNLSTSHSPRYPLPSFRPVTQEPLKSWHLKSFSRWLTWNVHDNSSSFSDNRCPSSHVPAVDAHVVVSVSWSTRYQTHVDSCTARGANTVDGNRMSALHWTVCDTLLTSRWFCKSWVCERFSWNQTLFVILFKAGIWYISSEITSVV